MTASVLPVRDLPHTSRLVTYDCNNCGFDGDVEEITDLGGSRWVCPDCEEPHDSAEDHDYDDPDADRDRWLEGLL